MKQQKILFFSFYGHQYRYFKFLTKHLNSRYKVYHINVYRSIIRRLLTIINPFNRVTKNTEVTFERREINEIIEFSYKKNKAGSNLFKYKFTSSILKKIIGCQSKLLIKYFNKFLLANDIDLVIVWNGLPYPAASVTALAGKLGIKTLFMENGFFPGTLTVDPQGVNQYNSLTVKESDFYYNVEIERNQLKKLRARGIKKVETIGRETESNSEKLPDKFIFLPFQVYDDTQILIHSPLIENMEQLLEVTLKAVKKINESLNEDYWIVAKEHPEDVKRKDYDFLRKKYSHQKVRILKTYDTGKLITDSRAVVTINSTVGIEALLYYKPVVTLGKAFYNIADLVYHVNSPGQLSDRIMQALEKGVNRELIDHFLYFLRYEYLVEANKNNPTRENNSQVLERIESVLAGRKEDWM